MKNLLLQWHKIADDIASVCWNNNNMALVVAGDKKITLIKKADGVAACAATCPHAGALMSEGFLDALGNIVCPLHKYKFSLSNGRNVSGEGYYLKIFPVEVRQDGIYVGL